MGSIKAGNCDWAELTFKSLLKNDLQAKKSLYRLSLSAVIIYLRIIRCKLSNTNVPVLFVSYILHSLFWQPLPYLAFLPLWRRDGCLPGDEGRSPPIYSSTIRWFRFSHELFRTLLVDRLSFLLTLNCVPGERGKVDHYTGQHLDYLDFHTHPSCWRFLYFHQTRVRSYWTPLSLTD